MLAATTIVTVTLNPAIDRLIEVPNFATGAHFRGRRIDVYPSGKGITVSRVLAQLGTRNIATGLVGAQELTLFERFLNESGDRRVHSQLLRVNGPTRDYITIVDPINDVDTYIRDVGFEALEVDIARIRSKIGLMAREDTVICFCGSTPPGMSLDTFRDMVDRSVDAGAKVVVDTTPDALQAVMDIPFWMLRTNRATARLITGIEVADRESAARAATEFAKSFGVATVSAKADGAALAAGNQCWIGHAGVHPGRVVNTVGCGDSLLAGILHEWLRSTDWVKALREGIAAASANTTSVRAGDIDLETVEEFRGVATIDSFALESASDTPG
ncbi:MAG: 1-phosphofructokinase family hexose kinase [Phycisphaerales bacterium]